MKLCDGFITYATESEQIMVAAGDAARRFHGMVRSNRTAAFIIDCLKTPTTRDAIVSRLEARFDAPRDVIGADVDRVLDALREIGAIHE